MRASSGSVANSMRPNLFLTLAICTVFAVFVSESISSKTLGGSASGVAIATLFLIPLCTIGQLNLSRLMQILGTIWPLLMLAALYALGSHNSVMPDMEGQGIRTAVFIVMTGVAFACGMMIASHWRNTVILSVVFAALILASTRWLIGFNEGSAYGFASTKNVVSGLLMHLAFLWAFLSTKSPTAKGAGQRFMLAALCCSAIAVIVSHRVMLPAAMAAAIIYVVLRRRNQNAFLAAAVFGLALAYEYGLFLFISQLNTLSFLSDLNASFAEFTGRRLTSGREELWSLSAYYLTGNWLFGLGPSVLPGDLFETELSSTHNSFLQVTLQTGLCGLLLLLVQLGLIVKRLSQSLRGAGFALALGYFVFVMIHASTEAFLTSNNFFIAAVVWLNFGVLCGGIAPEQGRLTPAGRPHPSPALPSNKAGAVAAGPITSP